MKIAFIGAPGSGKTWLAEKLSYLFNLKHIEADKLFWQDDQELEIEEFRRLVEEATSGDDWIYEGHIGKVSDIVLVRADKVIVIDYPNSLSLFRSLKRESVNLITGPHRLSSLKKMLFNFQNYDKLKVRRDELIQKQQNVIYWENGTDGLDELVEKFKN